MKLTELGSRATARLPVVIVAALTALAATGCSSSSGTTGVTSGTSGTTSATATSSTSGTTTATTTSGATTTTTTATTSSTTGTATGTTGTGSTTGATTSSSGSVQVLASGLLTGIPSGIGISSDSTLLYVAAQDPATGTDAVANVTVATGAVSYTLNGYVGDGGFGPGLVEPAGLQGNPNTGGFYTYVDGLQDVYEIEEGDSVGTFLGPAVAADGGFISAFDAVDDGVSTIYFTGLGANGSTVFAIADDGSVQTATDLAVTGLTAGFGIAISSDGNTLYVADPAAETDTFASGAITGTTLGQIVSVPVAGGAAAAVSGTPGYVPAAVAVLTPNVGVGTDILYFTGKDPTTGAWGLFSVSPSGGAVSTIAEGAPFINPSGLVVLAGPPNVAYVVDVGQVLAITLP